MTESPIELGNPLRYAVAPRQRTPIDSDGAAWSKADRFVDGLLISWYEWRRGYRLGKGYRSSDSTCQDYQTPGHWDRGNGLHDQHIETEIMRGVDRAISRVPNDPPWRTAIEFDAMTLAGETGALHSLPADPVELDVLRLEARNMLMRELQREGVMSA